MQSDWDERFVALRAHGRRLLRIARLVCGSHDCSLKFDGGEPAYDSTRGEGDRLNGPAAAAKEQALSVHSGSRVPHGDNAS